MLMAHLWAWLDMKKGAGLWGNTDHLCVAVPIKPNRGNNKVTKFHTFRLGQSERG